MKEILWIVFVLLISIVFGYIYMKVTPIWRKYKTWLMGTFFAFLLIGMYYQLSICEPFMDMLPSSVHMWMEKIRDVQNVASDDSKPNPTVKKEKRNVTASMKKWIAAKQEWKCAQCQKLLDETYEVDHEIPLHKGGKNDRENLQALCPHCHRKKTFEEAMNGFE